MRRALWIFVLHLSLSQANADPVLRVGSIPTGTLKWELATIQDLALDKKNQITLEVIPLANPEAAKIAILGQNVDLIVGDWVWVAKQRNENRDLKFSPFSTSHGALVVPPNSPIQKITDLKDRKLGIAGGGLDKNWLLLKALASKEFNLNLAATVEPVFAAPPLLNESLKKGELDALLTYWNYAAKLEAEGYRTLITGKEILQQLGVKEEVPSLGYIFPGQYASRHPTAISGFLNATATARETICKSETQWKKLEPVLDEKDPNVRDRLRSKYCEGTVKVFGQSQIEAAKLIYSLLEEKKGVMPDGVFWSKPEIENK